MDEPLLSTPARRRLSVIPSGPIRRLLHDSINLLDNYTRGRVAEVIVADCCDGELVGDGYGSWDVQWDAIRIEVKASGSVQSWPQKRRSPPNFSIARAAGWIEQGDGSFLEDPEKLRRSDVYVFGHHEGGKPDVPEEWTFYVVPTSRIDHVCGDQATIALSSIVARLNPAVVGSDDLADSIADAASGPPESDKTRREPPGVSKHR